jgi:cytoskeletal protein CcmA (bactofilin family)
MEEPEVSDDQVRCPHCKTTRLKVLKKLDRIEKLYGNPLINRMRARRGDTIYHCVYCRLQFYDPRRPGDVSAPGKTDTSAKSEKSEPEPAPPVIAPAPVSTPAPAPPVVQAAPVNGHTVPRPSDSTNLTVGVSIRGSIHSEEDLYLDCRIDGTVVAKEHRVVVGPNAKLKSAVQAADVEVRGTLHGNSQAVRKMVLRSGCHVTGDIKAGDIVIEDGAQFKGSVELVREQPRLPLI